MNKKGFMMAEVIVVSSIVLIVLVSLFASYSKIFKIYNERMTYNDITALYRLSYVRDNMIDDKKNDINTFLSTKKVTDPTQITSYINTDLNASYREIVYLVYVGDTIDNLKKIDGVNPTFKDYINYLSASAKVGSDFLMLMEICDKDNQNKYVNNCRYAYLEIYA